MDELAQTREALAELVAEVRTVYRAAQADAAVLGAPLRRALLDLHDLAEATAEDYELDLDVGASEAERAAAPETAGLPE